MDCETCELCVDQPPEWEHLSVDGIAIKQMYLAKTGTMVPQHAHRYDHTSMLATGSVRMWKEGEFIADFQAPCPIFIKRGVKHTFQSLEDSTLIYCIHNASRLGSIEIVAEHQLSH
jgi:quercetin dioxygenase-like cupin family protein